MTSSTGIVRRALLAPVAACVLLPLAPVVLLMWMCCALQRSS